MNYVQGSNSVDEVRSRAIGGPGGRHVAKAPMRYPGAPVHAVPSGTKAAACGAEVLLVFEQKAWESRGGHSRDWCPECDKLVPKGA